MVTAAAVKERPILMRPEMVVSTLEDRKGQTRRVMKPQPYPDPMGIHELHWDPPRGAWACSAAFLRERTPSYCPYGQPGDRLWVRETWFPNHWDWRNAPHEEVDLHYRADHWGSRGAYFEDGTPRWRPSIFMPRWASRITLEITEIRVERVQGITPEDVLAEGVGHELIVPHEIDTKGGALLDGVAYQRDLLSLFELVWESINGKKYPWASDPWVWVIGFKRLNT